MIRFQHILPATAFMAIALSGCSKFLEKEPDNRAKLNTPEKVSQLLGTAYPQASYQLMGEISSDNASDLVTTNLDVQDWIQLDEDMYFWRDNKGTGTNEDTPEGYWFGCYKAIAAANQALDAIEQASDKQPYSAQKGEALVARAYAHFMLVNFFAKFYDASTAATDPGIPYVTEPETVSIKKYERKTVQYVYDMIEKDLLEGMPLINDNAYKVPKYHFNRTAANAFAARFYLYQQDYANVIKYCTAAIPEAAIASSLRPWNTVYNTLPLNGNGSLSQTYSAASEKANLLLVETLSWWSRINGLARYGPNREVVNSATGDEPITGKPFAFSAAQYMSGHPFVAKIDEFFVETSIGSGIGNGWQMIPLFTAEEVLFNLAEAYSYSSQTDKAINLLNIYLSKRLEGYNANTDLLTASKITNAVGTNNLPQALIILNLYYRQLEFLHEGMRWFDILRYDIDVTHDQLDGNGNVLRTITLEAGDKRRVFQLPPTTVESGLEPNPR